MALLASIALATGASESALGQSKAWSKAESQRAERTVEQCVPKSAPVSVSTACIGRAAKACWAASRGTQEIRACSNIEYAVWESRLHNEEARFRKLLMSDDARAFDAREKVWLKFVEDDCLLQAEHAPFGDGTLDDFAHCEMIAVAERTAALSRSH